MSKLGLDKEQIGLLSQVLADLQGKQQGQDAVSVPIGNLLVGTDGNAVNLKSKDLQSGVSFVPGENDFTYNNRGLTANYNPYSKLSVNYAQPNGVFYGITNGSNDLSIGRNTDTTNANISYNRPNQSVWFNFNKKF